MKQLPILADAELPAMVMPDGIVAFLAGLALSGGGDGDFISRRADQSGAVFSTCERYRYALWRRWDEDKPMVMFLMLNPSTADEEKNDPTVERCEIRAREYGFGGLYVGNIFALRGKDPKCLRGDTDPVGGNNDYALFQMAMDSAMVVCAFGNIGMFKGRAKVVLQNLRAHRRQLHALYVNTTCYPKHPLYVGYEHKPKPWHGVLP